MKNTTLIWVIIITLKTVTGWAQLPSPYLKISPNLAPCRPGTFNLQINNKITSLKLGTSGSLATLKPLSDDGTVFPENVDKNVAFISSLWIGGLTTDNEVRFAGTTYRSNTDNFDWVCGPLDENGQTEEITCRIFDRIFVVKRPEIYAAYNLMFDKNGKLNSTNCDLLPQNILFWPGKGNPNWPYNLGQSIVGKDLATFYDYNQDGVYNACDGDLPCLETNGKKAISHAELLSNFPEFLTFNVINDNGNIHRLSGGKNLKMEVHTYTFSHPVNEKEEDVTFIKFKTIYKGNDTLHDVFLSIWVDPNLGCYPDDYIGTSSQNDLVYVYNKDTLAQEEQNFCPGLETTFDGIPPIMAFSFIKGFDIPKNEGGTVALVDAGLTSSIYTYNCALGTPEQATCDPEDQDIFFYRNMKGKWKNGLPITEAGSGYNAGSIDSTLFVFDGNPKNLNDWTMCSAKPESGDYRFLMTTGGSVMTKGSVNEALVAITLTKGDNSLCPDISKVVELNNDTKQLYDNNWQRLNGPFAPDLTYEQEDKKITFNIVNNPKFNNPTHNYKEKIPGLADQPENYYQFEGYQIYQVNNLSYDPDLLGDSNSVVVYQCDKINDIVDLSNWEYKIDSINKTHWIKTIKVSGNNQGIQEQFSIDQDFLNGGPLLKNKEYYYVAVAYAYNNFETFDSNKVSGQQKTYIRSTNNIKIYTIKPAFNDNKTPIKITRLKGEGTYHYLNLNSNKNDSIVYSGFCKQLEFTSNNGPFDIIVVDSNKIKKGEKFLLQIKGPFNDQNSVCEFRDDSTFYEITDLKSGQVYASKNAINIHSDQYFEELGIVVSFHQPDFIGTNTFANGGYLQQKYKYLNENGIKWFNSTPDIPDSINGYNHFIVDPATDININNLQKITELGSFFPFQTSKTNIPGDNKFSISTLDPDNHAYFKNPNLNILDLKYLNNVDLVFTADKSKWSRCIVVETAPEFYRFFEAPLDKSKMLTVRKTKSVDKNGLPDNTSTQGYSWFPGYAIDLDKGERINLFFGENTTLRYLDEKNGIDPKTTKDMLFNPGSEIFYDTTLFSPLDIFLGGHHFIYITRQAYDGCTQLHQALNVPEITANSWDAISSVTWTSIPLLKKGESWLSMDKGLIPNDLTISLRIEKPFQFSQKNENLEDMRKCNSEFEYPLYQFELVNGIISSTENQTSTIELPWKFMNSFHGFILSDVTKKCRVQVFNLTGQMFAQAMVNPGEEYIWSNEFSNINNNMIFTKVQDFEKGKEVTYKTILIND